MNQAWIEAIARYGPWAILAFSILWVLYKTVVPAVLKVLETNQTMLAAHLKEIETARKEEHERHMLMMEKRDAMAGQIHREQMQAMQAMASELRSLSERLPNRRQGERER